MALSNAEKVRRYRERQKAKKQEAMKTPTQNADLFKTPFFEVFTLDDQYDSLYAHSLELAGVQPLYFTDDSGPEACTLDDLSDSREESGFSNPFGDSKGSSLGKAEVLIGCLIDAAHDLAHRVRDYKYAEIRARIAEIEQTDLSDPEIKRAAFATVAELNAMLVEFNKEIRVPMPKWKPDIFIGTFEEWLAKQTFVVKFES
ncbi:hypothetical protein C8J30_105201 [Rhodobacter viridis]|uniref:Uncharacterized protein n=1 Tax=Rhodobacter viridis TaxID=1054202 RepID=A0A318UDF6_9RHOB|nr:hypothetical protein [Rhodobacter viridis]PYF10390.1 hypothetical protein C8J30_105201 [Rhodobacter viridis]